MIVQIDYRIAKPYEERLSTMEGIILSEIQRRKKVVDLVTALKERAYAAVFKYEIGGHTCYSCRKPVFFLKDEVLFMEMTRNGISQTYFHLSCVKQKV